MTRMIGFILGFIGVLILMGWKAVSATPAFVIAASAGLIAALTYAIAAPYIKQKLTGVPSLAITVGSQLGAAVFLLSALPFTIPQQPITEGIAIAVLGLALLSTAFAYILYFRLIQNIGATKALTVTYLMPLFAMLWGALFLNEATTVSMIVGCSLILLGTAIANGLFTKTFSLDALLHFLLEFTYFYRINFFLFH